MKSLHNFLFSSPPPLHESRLETYLRTHSGKLKRGKLLVLCMLCGREVHDLRTCQRRREVGY
jgi:hypothetical protein